MVPPCRRAGFAGPFLVPDRHFRECETQLSGKARQGVARPGKDCMMRAVKVISPYLANGGTATASPLRLL